MKIFFSTLILLLSFLFASHAFAYMVKNGDTMTKIAAESNLTLEELAAANPQIQNLNLIYVGQTVNTENPNEPLSSPENVSFLKNLTYTGDDMDLLGRLIRAEAFTWKLTTVDPLPQNLPIDKTTNTEIPKTTEGSSEKASYSDYELDLLARLVRAEAQTEPFEGKIAVACVVLNRVESPAFPNTIKGVIYERGQFQPVKNGEINKSADSESIAAVKAALTEKRNIAHESLFFYNPTIARSHWLAKRTTTLVLGQHVFKK